MTSFPRHPATLSQALRHITRGQPKVIFAATPEQALIELEHTDPEHYDADTRIIMVRLQLSLINESIDKTLAALAALARTLLPEWESNEPGTDGREPGEAVNHRWRERAIALCKQGKPPLPKGFSDAQQATQLTLCLNRGPLVIILYPEQDEVDETQLYSLARVGEWLAARTRGKIALLLPAIYCKHSALDSISYGAMTLAPPREALETPEEREGREIRNTPETGQEPDTRAGESLDDSPKISRKQTAPSAWIFPFLGKPHPCSPGEQIVAQLIKCDKQLKNLFLYNHLIRGRRGGAHICDLVWPDGRLVVEIDGYRYHSSADAFRADRKRDRELLLSDYRVMRLPHDEVIADPRRAVNEIKDMVRFIQQKNLSQGDIS